MNSLEPLLTLYICASASVSIRRDGSPMSLYSSWWLTARFRTFRSGEWLASIANAAPPNVRFVVTATDEQFCNTLSTVLGSDTLGSVAMEGIQITSTHAIVSARTAAATSSRNNSVSTSSTSGSLTRKADHSQRGSGGDGNGKNIGGECVLSAQQHRYLTEGRIASSKDRAGNAIHIVYGCGLVSVNGWYRKVNIGESTQKVHRVLAYLTCLCTPLCCEESF